MNPKKIFQNKKGQGLVEFGLLFPVILFLLLFLIEAGLLIGSYVRVLNISREAARQIVVNQDEEDVRAKIVDHFGNTNAYALTTGGISFSYSDNKTRENVVRGDSATAWVEASYTPLTNLLELLIPNKITARSVMMIEN